MDERTDDSRRDRPREMPRAAARPRGRVQPAAALLAASAAQTAAYAAQRGGHGRPLRETAPARAPAGVLRSLGADSRTGARSAAPGEPEPRISVVLPAYNAVRNGRGYFEEALESVAAQSYAPLELIVVDDGSSDGTGEAATAFAAAHPGLSVTLLSQENGGQSSARNLGASRAAGDWLAFLDQDDRWKAQRLEVVDAAPGRVRRPRVHRRRHHRRRRLDAASGPSTRGSVWAAGTRCAIPPPPSPATSSSCRA